MTYELRNLSTEFSRLNDYRQDSEVSQINEASVGAQMTVSPLMSLTLNKSRKAYEISDGVFNVFIGGLKKKWQKSSESRPVEEPKEAFFNLVSVRKIDKAKDFQLDFGGISKGIAVDCLIDILKSYKCQGALVQFGGEISSFGLKPSGEEFTLACPYREKDGYFKIPVPSSGISVSQSSNEYQPIIVNEQKYYHIFDSKSGLPANTEKVNTTVIIPGTEKCWLSDALSTASTVSGIEEVTKYLNSHKGAVRQVVKAKEYGLRAFESSFWGSYIEEN